VATYWKEIALGLVAAVLLGWVACQAYRMRPGGKAPPQSPNAVVCSECGWRGKLSVDSLPAKCPKCGKMAVHFAGVCPNCGEWTPWDPGREEILFARPRLFMDWGAAWFFPSCSKCGTETNATGRSVRLPDAALAGGEP